MIRTLSLIFLITTLFACATGSMGPSGSQAPIPELRALVIGNPLAPDEDAVLAVEDAHAGNFNAIVLHVGIYPGDEGDWGAQAVAQRAHELGMTFALRVEWALEAGESLDQAAERVTERILAMMGDESLDGFGINQPMRQGTISLVPIIARIKDEWPGVKIFGSGAMAVDLAHVGMIDVRVAHVIPDIFGSDIGSTLDEMPPHFPQVVRVGLWPGTTGVIGDMAGLYITERIQLARRYPFVGVTLHRSGSFKSREAIRAMAYGPFATPAIPPHRDWRWSLERSIDLALESPDMSPLLRDGVSSLSRSLKAHTATDLQIHQALDYLLRVSDESGTDVTLAHRHLEFALLCLRQAQAD